MSLTSVCVLLSAVLLMESVKAQDYTAVPALNASYRVHRESDWAGAVKACAEYGGHLWAPRSLHEARLVTAALQLSSIQPWVGYSYNSKHGQWMSTKGKSLVEDVMWAQLLPELRQGQSCTGINREGRLDLWDCSEVGAFICEAEQDDILKGNNGLFEGYSYIGGFRASYKLHYKIQNWSGAQKACAEEGGLLWEPLMLEEVQAVLLTLNTTGLIPWVGYSDQAKEGVWISQHDGELTLYQKWDQGKPNGGQLSNCAGISAEGLLSDWNCETTGSFICKVGPAGVPGRIKVVLERPSPGELYKDDPVNPVEPNQNISNILKEITERLSNEILLVSNKVSEFEKKSYAQFEVLTNQLQNKLSEENVAKEKEWKNIFDKQVEMIRNECQETQKQLIDSSLVCSRQLTELRQAIKKLPIPIET